MPANITAKTPRGAANQVLKAILKLPGGEYAKLRPNGESTNGGYQVVWEAGPYGWPLAATGGEDIFFQEYAYDGYPMGEATFLFDRRHVFAEPENSFTLNFWYA